MSQNVYPIDSWWSSPCLLPFFCLIRMVFPLSSKVLGVSVVSWPEQSFPIVCLGYKKGNFFHLSSSILGRLFLLFPMMLLLTLPAVFPSQQPLIPTFPSYKARKLLNGGSFSPRTAWLSLAVFPWPTSAPLSLFCRENSQRIILSASPYLFPSEFLIHWPIPDLSHRAGSPQNSTFCQGERLQLNLRERNQWVMPDTDNPHGKGPLKIRFYETCCIQ